ncbi:membrane integrity-associated transporter subunit PqiC [Aquabacterium sp. J223]|uniref:PqiC family protein n=1 Tax=Aquabacterium sp. J223 TaxID=2898431 RepID=UPI0021AD63F5|nr:PqiC family protein [Aquabacterium sp. J223]UUX96301.1 PqiC family protein [Aquabacterium sp. J223]
MRPLRPCTVALLGALLVALAGCAGTPAVRLHSLRPPAPAGAAAGPVPSLSVQVERVAVPPGQDGAEWRVRDGQGTLHQLEQQRWTAPLPDELRAALVAGLALQGVRAGGDAAAPRLVVELLRFESTLGGPALQEVVWTLRGAEGTPALQCLRRSREAAPGGYEGLAEAHRRAWQRLAADVAGVLQRPPGSEAPRCPAT